MRHDVGEGIQKAGGLKEDLKSVRMQRAALLTAGHSRLSRSDWGALTSAVRGPQMVDDH